MNRTTKIILKVMWGGFIALWVGILLLFVLIYNGIIGYMPPVEQLQNPIDKYASQVYASDGTVIGSYAESGSNRILTTYENLSPNLINALIATEDVRFKDHSGIDFRALMRAVIKTGLFRDKSGGGGSTITQQLSKQLFSPRVETPLGRIFQKPIEWMIALKLEKYYTKEEIIAMYLNQFDFLYNAIGIRSAARTYFNKLPSELSVNESAMLVGMCKNPAIFNPVLQKGTDKAVGRRNVVLHQMEKAGYLSSAEADSLSAMPLLVSFRPMTHSSGEAPYFREYIRHLLTAKKPQKSDYPSFKKEQYAIDSLEWEQNPLYGWCNKNTKGDGSHYDLYLDGLKIYTALDLKLQKYAEKAMQEVMSRELQPAFDREQEGNPSMPFSRDLTTSQRERIMLRSMHNTDRWRNAKRDGVSDSDIIASFHRKRTFRLWTWNGEKTVTMTPLDSLRYMKRQLRSGMIALEPLTGHILAYVGGINFEKFQYDMVNQARRQIGSTIKPFLYAQSMMDGLTPCSSFVLNPVTLHDTSGRPYTPRGHSSHAGEVVTVAWGLQHSDNWVTAYLMSLTTPMAFVKILRSFGLQGPLTAEPSLCMGAADASVMEMASAYTTFAAGGIRSDAMPIVRIEDQFGNVLANFTPRIREVLTQNAAAKTLYMLEKVVDGGTGGRLRYRYNLRNALAGKTGTTQNNSDGWFVGLTPDIVAAVWVGGEERSIRFRSGALGQGAATALPIFGTFIRYVYNDPKTGFIDRPFDFPPNFNPCGGGRIVEPLTFDPSHTDSTDMEYVDTTDVENFF